MRAEARDPFTWWYPLTTVAARTGKNARTIRRAMLSGKFGPAPGPADQPQPPGVLVRHVCGEWLFPWDAVAIFLGLSAPESAPVSESWRVRTEGELRRQVAACPPVQTLGGNDE